VEIMTLMERAFDVVLGLGLLWLAWRALASQDLFKAIVLFIVFGLLMALVWVRLDAPDIALAEIAIGAGLTGALLLAALARLHAIPFKRAAIPTTQEIFKRQYLRWLLIICLLGLLARLVYAILALPTYSSGLSEEVAANLEASGVSNPVTAVLLNFRGYDTMLEMFVLLMALLGTWLLGGLPSRNEMSAGPVLDTFSRFMVPIFILAAAYLLWVGAVAPGGAFQAGSVLGAAGVLLLLADWQPHANLTQWPLRLALIAGAGTFVSVGLLTMLYEGQLLAYPTAQAGLLILFLESLAAISIGVTLAALFLRSPADTMESK
jgi:multisubunit Na+/H+ antiporter MnhB subunit